jgi:uncharacterized membrane protein
MPQTQIQEHVDLIARHEQEFLAQRTRAERIGDSIASLVGSLVFVAFNLAVFFGWVAWNLAPRVRHFDPPPFSLLGTVLALEAILTASFILMRQARTSRRSDERDHLMLQVLLLSEKEITALLKINRQIANHLGLDRAANNPELRELSQHTSIDDVAQSIKENLPAAE